MRLTASEASYNSVSGDIEAAGRISFTDPKAYLEAEHASYNVVTEAGTFSGVHGYIHPPSRSRAVIAMTSKALFIRAREVSRLDEDHYTLEDGSMTSCEDEGRGWSLHLHRARLTVDNDVVSYGDTFHFLGLPILYAPVLAHSIAPTPRHTGFLLPDIGDSTLKGRIVGDAFYWAINSSADLLVGADDYSLRGPAYTGRFRATPSDTSQLLVNYFEVNDHGSRFVRAPGESLSAQGEAQNLFGGFRGLADIDYVNSMAFRLTWSGNFNEAVSSEARQTGFLTKNFDAYSLNFYAERYEDFLCAQPVVGTSSPNAANPCTAPQASSDRIIIEHTPSVSFSRLDRPIGDSPFYFGFDTSADGLARDEPGFSTPALTERLDFHPEVALRVPQFDGFHLTPSFGAEVTHYGTSLLGPHVPLTRGLGDFSLDLRPPSLERVFNRSIHHYRLKHIVESDIRYQLVRATDPEQITDIVRFDDTDIFTETHELEYSLKTTLYGRHDSSDSDPNPPQARELASLSLTEKYYFDPTFGGALQPGQNVFASTLELTGFAFAEGRRLSPVVTVLKLAPFSNYDTEVRADLSPYGGVLNAGITSSIHRGQLALQATDFFISRTEQLPFELPITPGVPTSALPSQNLFNTRVTYGSSDRKGLSGALGLNYNITQGVANAVVGQVTYNFSCFGVDVGWNRFNLGPLRDENLFRFAISLSNVGSFGNLKTRDRLYQ